MINIILQCVVVAAMIIVAICQIKQAFFPIIYQDYDVEQAGVEIPKDNGIDVDDPTIKAIINACERAKTYEYPGTFIEQVINDSGETGVEIITEQQEVEGR